MLQFELVEEEKLDDIRQLVRLQPHKREDSRIVGSVCTTYTRRNIPRISSNFDGMNEELVGAAYVNGQISVYDSNQSDFQINCTRNWENLSSKHRRLHLEEGILEPAEMREFSIHEDLDEEPLIRSQRHRYAKEDEQQR
ncbi:hypothetical protein K0M31_010710 [Melipona bicolor]|uniref:Uncharacterized protein n=1 Tax=Melipona bicolor TaxID=60889 RepID=A0AA40FL82_9HYME|nr:hypothetical protein K0M31_010710 [Melipona bicolor]